jgi:hypothetical protein
VRERGRSKLQGPRASRQVGALADQTLRADCVKTDWDSGLRRAALEKLDDAALMSDPLLRATALCLGRHAPSPARTDGGSTPTGTLVVGLREPEGGVLDPEIAGRTSLPVSPLSPANPSSVLCVAALGYDSGTFRRPLPDREPRAPSLLRHSVASPAAAR